MSFEVAGCILIIIICFFMIIKNNNNYWYLISFNDEGTFKSIVITLKYKKVKLIDMVTTRELANCSDNAILIAVSYLGKGSINDFKYGTTEIPNSEDK